MRGSGKGPINTRSDESTLVFEIFNKNLNEDGNLTINRPRCNTDRIANAYKYINIGSSPFVIMSIQLPTPYDNIRKQDVSPGNKYNRTNMSGTISPPPHNPNKNIRGIIKRENSRSWPSWSPLWGNHGLVHIFDIRIKRRWCR